MPTVSLNRKIVETLVGKTFKDTELKHHLAYLGTDLESLDKETIHVEIFPNRPDMLSEQGLARALKAYLGLSKKLPHYEAKKSTFTVHIDKSVAKVRPHTACAIVKGVKMTDDRIKEIIQMQEKLHVSYGRNRKRVAIGIYPLEHITLPITFTAKDPTKIRFQPLESPREMTGLQTLSQHSAGREYGHLLEGKKTFPFFIDAADQVLSMPPIINSHQVGKVSETTTEVFIECSGFDYPALARCLNIIVCAFSDMGGTIYQMNIKQGNKTIKSPDLQPTETPLQLDYVNRRLGLSLTEKTLTQLLRKMGHQYHKGKVSSPCYRADILHPVDLTEDIAIAYGYDRISAHIPKISTTGKEQPMNIFRKKVAEILAGLGLLECKTYHLSNKELQHTRMQTTLPLIELSNALNAEYSVLRAWMLPSMLEVLHHNKHHELPHELYGMGSVFFKDNHTETGIGEAERMAVVICREEADYTHIKQILDYLMRMLGATYKVESTTHDSFTPGRVGRVSVGKKKVAYLGEIHPQVLTHWELTVPVVAFELNLTDLFEAL